MINIYETNETKKEPWAGLLLPRQPWLSKGPVDQSLASEFGPRAACGPTRRRDASATEECNMVQQDLTNTIVILHITGICKFTVNQKYPGSISRNRI